jgi:hypothetical protein
MCSRWRHGRLSRIGRKSALGCRAAASGASPVASGAHASIKLANPGAGARLVRYSRMVNICHPKPSRVGRVRAPTAPALGSSRKRAAGAGQKLAKPRSQASARAKYPLQTVRETPKADFYPIKSFLIIGIISKEANISRWKHMSSLLAGWTILLWITTFKDNYELRTYRICSPGQSRASRTA